MTAALPHNRMDWARLLRDRRDKPTPIPGPLSDQHRAEFITYNLGIGPVMTPDLRRIEGALHAVLEANEAAALGGRRCLLIDGPAGMGKSQAVVTAALRDTKRVPEDTANPSATTSPIPWIYVEASAAGQGRALMRSICEFTGLPISPRDSADDLLARLRNTAPSMGLRAIIVDDAHMLRNTDRDSRRLADFLKSALTGLPVTFVFVGAGLHESALLRRSGGGYPASEQIARRATLLEVPPWPLRFDGDDDWAKLVMSMADLLAHPGGREQIKLNNKRAVTMLHQGSGGLVGVMIDWLKFAASAAIRADRALDVDVLKMTAPTLGLRP